LLLIARIQQNLTRGAPAWLGSYISLLKTTSEWGGSESTRANIHGPETILDLYLYEVQLMVVSTIEPVQNMACKETILSDHECKSRDLIL